MTNPAKYFVRAEDATHFHVVMLDDDFETIIDYARSQEMADRKAARWGVKEALANARVGAGQ
jgi:hypothetical protein